MNILTKHLIEQYFDSCFQDEIAQKLISIIGDLPGDPGDAVEGGVLAIYFSNRMAARSYEPYPEHCKILFLGLSAEAVIHAAQTKERSGTERYPDQERYCSGIYYKGLSVAFAGYNCTELNETLSLMYALFIESHTLHPLNMGPNPYNPGQWRCNGLELTNEIKGMFDTTYSNNQFMIPVFTAFADWLNAKLPKRD